VPEPYRVTLVTDGASDRALAPIVEWAVKCQMNCAVVVDWLDQRRMPRVRGQTLSERIETAMALFPAELLVVHRDAERDDHASRTNEVDAAIRATEFQPEGHAQVVPVVPVRMTESWLLICEEAIRRAALNPNGHERLNMPRLQEIERLPNPKQQLFDLLKDASGLRGRRLKKFNLYQARLRVADQIEDFAPLRQLPAFQAFEERLCVAL